MVFRGPSAFVSDDVMIVCACEMKRDFSGCRDAGKDSQVDRDMEDELETGPSYSISLFLSIYLLSQSVYLDALILVPVSFLK